VTKKQAPPHSGGACDWMENVKASKNHKGTCTHQRKAFIQTKSKQETQGHVHAPAKSVYSNNNHKGA